MTASNRLEAIALQPNGKILMAIGFVGTNQSGLPSINADGSLDSSFNVGAGPALGNDEPTDGPKITGIAVHRDGRILVGGNFQQFEGVARDGLVRLFGDPVVPLSLTFTRTGQTSLNLQVNGTADVVVVESADNLNSPWQSLMTVTLSDTNSLPLQIASMATNHFFRARIVP